MIKGYADKAADVFGNDAAKASAALSDKRQYDNITKNVRKSSEFILPPLAHHFVNLANAACISVRGNPQNFGETRLYSPNTVMHVSPKSVEVKD